MGQKGPPANRIVGLRDPGQYFVHPRWTFATSARDPRPRPARPANKRAPLSVKCHGSLRGSVLRIEADLASAWHNGRDEETDSGHVASIHHQVPRDERRVATRASLAQTPITRRGRGLSASAPVLRPAAPGGLATRGRGCRFPEAGERAPIRRRACPRSKDAATPDRIAFF